MELAQLIALVVAELGAEAGGALVTHAQAQALEDDSNATLEMRVGEAIWDDLAHAKPEAFVGRIHASTAVGLAYRYARRRTPDLVLPVDLTPAERRVLQQTRRYVVGWSGLRQWHSFRHVMYDERCIALTGTVGLRRGYSGGFAFTWHRGLAHTALYPAPRISEYRKLSTASLVSVLLHEETHLAAALEASFGDDEDDLREAVFEAAAEVVQHTACLLACGFEPTRAELLDYLAEIGEEQLILFTAFAGPTSDIPELVRRSCTLAVAAARGQRALETVIAPRPLTALARVFGDGP